MAHLVVNLPPVRCYVRKEFLYDFQKGHGEFEPCFWVSLKSIRGEAFRIESYLHNYGALYDKLPLSAYVWKTEVVEDEMMPLDYLQIWDCMSYDVTVIEKKLISGLRCRFLNKDKNWIWGTYMFTVDSSASLTPTSSTPASARTWKTTSHSTSSAATTDSSPPSRTTGPSSSSRPTTRQS